MSNEDHDEKKDAELSSWRGEWQTLGGKDDLAAELVARAAKDGKRMRAGAVREVLAATFSTGVCSWLVVRSHGELEVVVMTAFILLFNGAWLTHFFTVRADLFRTSGEGVESFVALTRKRLATEHRWVVAARRWTLALMVPLVPWSIWVFIAHRDAYMTAPWRAIAGFGTAAVILIGVLLWTRVKERRISVETEAFERHVAEVQLA
jgi:hypothetical protein